MEIYEKITKAHHKRGDYEMAWAHWEYEKDVSWIEKPLNAKKIMVIAFFIDWPILPSFTPIYSAGYFQD